MGHWNGGCLEKMHLIVHKLVRFSPDAAHYTDQNSDYAQIA